MKRGKENRRRAASCKLQGTGCRLQVTGCRLQAASFELRAASKQENLFVNLCETSVSSMVKKIFFILNFLGDFAPWREKDSLRLCAFAPLREKSLTTTCPDFKAGESTKKAQRKAASCKLQAASGESRVTSFEPRVASCKPQATSGQENLFVNLCETSVSSVVKKDFNTIIPLCAFAPWREKDSLRLCAFATLREKDSLRLCAFAVKNSSSTPGIRNPQPATRNPQPATRNPQLTTCSLQLAAIKKYSPAVLHSFTANSGVRHGLYINECPGTAAITFFFSPHSSSLDALNTYHHLSNNSHCLISPAAGRTGSGLTWRNAMA